LGEKSARLELRETGPLAGMSDALQDTFLSLSKLRKFRTGEPAYHIGDAPGGMFGIVRGTFGVAVASGDEMAMCHLLRSGTWFGAAPVLSQGPRVLSFQAVEASEALAISLADLHVVGARFPELYRQIGAMSERMVQVAAARIVGDLLISSGQRRLAAILVRLCGVWEGRPPAPIPLSQQAIGQMSNLSRDRVNRFLQELVGAGCIELRYGSVVVTDPEVLESIAQHGLEPVAQEHTKSQSRR
jgi:CRP/FNR family transcriptional regulator, cyclic AMP receptor protein